MTGYGRGSAETESLIIEVEARSVNHRYSNINIRLPRELNALENKVRQHAGQLYSRGRLDIFINMQHTLGAKTLKIDLDLAKEYYQALQQLKQELSLAEDVSLEMLAKNPSLFEIKEAQENEEQIWPILEQALNQCLQNLNQMRAKEGVIIVQDISERCSFLAQGINQLEPQLAQQPQNLEERLWARLNKNFSKIEFDNDRLLQEVALFAARCDATEEVVRFKSHLQQFQEWLQGKETPIGKKLDFLLQEMNRELTTLAAKVNDSEIIQAVVGLKSELEKIREQVQNIE